MQPRTLFRPLLTTSGHKKLQNQIEQVSHTPKFSLSPWLQESSFGEEEVGGEAING